MSCYNYLLKKLLSPFPFFAKRSTDCCVLIVFIMLCNSKIEEGFRAVHGCLQTTIKQCEKKLVNVKPVKVIVETAFSYQLTSDPSARNL